MRDTPGRYDYCPWLFWSAPEADLEAQRAWQCELADRLAEHGGTVELSQPAFVSPWAGVHTDRLVLGPKSYVAAFAYLTHDVETGSDCTLNPFATVRGHVRLGDDVRIGAHTSILGFNHGTAPDRAIHRQPTTSKGIRIGNDVWIGSHVVILDGVSVGEGCVIGAGAVVTRDLPEWSMAAGNPARVLRDRRDTPRTDDRASGGGTPSGKPLSARLVEFGSRAGEQLQAVLARCWNERQSAFLDHPGTKPTVRAWCDAVEIADLLAREPPPQRTGEEIAALLRARQDPDTGLLPEIGEGGPEQGVSLEQGPALYHILCAGYALRLLDSGFAHPIRVVHDLEPDALRARLGALDWRSRAWASGSWVDAIGTAQLWNEKDFGLENGVLDTLFGWLLRAADPWHGMWGRFDARQGRLQVVNGCYRLTRGTFAQYGLPLPYPERAIDTVLAHTHDRSVFAPPRGNACNVLDVIHPLWLCARQTDYRAAEGREWARTHLERALAGWQPDKGFSFDLRPGGDSVAGLQGTEMWLTIVWLLADYLGESEALGYRPRGIHRPEPAAAA